MLKLNERPKYANQGDEITAHKRATERAPQFSSRHIPQLVNAFDPGPGGFGYAATLKVCDGQEAELAALFTPV